MLLDLVVVIFEGMLLVLLLVVRLEQRVLDGHHLVFLVQGLVWVPFFLVLREGLLPLLVVREVLLSILPDFSLEEVPPPVSRLSSTVLHFLNPP